MFVTQNMYILHKNMSTGPRSKERAAGTGPDHRQLHPVLDRPVLRLAHTPHVALGDLVRHEHLATVPVHHLHGAVLWHHESLVVRAVLLRLGGHEPHVGGSASNDVEAGKMTYRLARNDL